MIVALFTKEIFKMVSDNSKAFIHGQMVINMTESGRRVRNKAKAFILLHLVINTMESFKMM